MHASNVGGSIMTKPQFFHLGFEGTAESSLEDNCLHGKILFISDLITYEGENPTQLRSAFVDAVDRYLDYCERTGKAPNQLNPLRTVSTTP